MNEFTATDDSGNSANCTFQVELNDIEPPNVTCEVEVSTEDPSLYVARYSASDNCAVEVSGRIQPCGCDSFEIDSGSIVDYNCELNEDTAVDCAVGNAAGNPPFVFLVTAVDVGGASIDCTATPPDDTNGSSTSSGSSSSGSSSGSASP